MTPEDFLALLPNVDYFYGAASGIHCRMEPGTCEHTIVFVSDSVLTQIHPSFPDAVRHSLNDYERYAGDDTAPGAVLVCQTAYYREPRVIQQNPFKPFGVCNIKDVRWDEPQQQVLVYGMQYSLEDEIKDDSGTPTKFPPYVSSTGVGWIKVPLGWMNTHYPAWLTRYQTAVTLDCDAAALVQHVFSNEFIAAPASLPVDVTTP